MKKTLLFLLVFANLFISDGITAMRLTGTKEATVQMLVYGDYYCPFTKRFLLYIPELTDEFGEDLSIVYAHFPLRMREPSVQAASAALCAHAQKLGLEFTMSMAQTNSVLSLDQYERMAESLGLADLPAFRRCQTSPETLRNIEIHFEAGRADGVSGTPNILINGEMVRGAFPIEHFQEMIRERL
jgi:protein-disulfide isomerase